MLPCSVPLCLWYYHNRKTSKNKIYLLCAGLTTLAKNRETWLLPERTWGRSEGMTGGLPSFQQLHKDMFPQKCVVSSHHLKKLHLKCAFANILLISFIYNFKFMFCIIVVDFIRFALKSVIYILHQNVSSFPCFN